MQRIETKSLKELPRFLKLKGQKEFCPGKTEFGEHGHGLVRVTWNGRQGWTNGFIAITGEIPESVSKSYEVLEMRGGRADLKIAIPLSVRRLVVESYVERAFYQCDPSKVCEDAVDGSGVRRFTSRKDWLKFLGYKNRGGVITFSDFPEIVVNSRFYQFLNKHYSGIEFWGEEGNFVIELRHAGEIIGCIMGNRLSLFIKGWAD